MRDLCFIILVIILFVILKKNNIERFAQNKPIFAIHTVFIAKENILFLEEWIDYHINLGFDKFYLYDNSKVTKPTKIGRIPLTKGINKYNINYNKEVNLSDLEVKNILNKIKNKYNIKLIEWSPIDKEGNIIYAQEKAHNDCLKKLKKDNIDWCAYIDIDEFIVLKNDKNIKDYVNKLDNNISNIRMSQVRFENRFINKNKLVIDIDKSQVKPLSLNHSNKNIFYVPKTNSLGVHWWKGIGQQKITGLKEILFNHYKLNNSKNYKVINNINQNIKNKIIKNSKKYIMNNIRKNS